MSLDLKDFRGKLTVEGWVAVEAEAATTGRERSEIVREIVHEWALQKIRAATLLSNTLEREGLSGIAGGISGNGEKTGS